MIQSKLIAALRRERPIRVVVIAVILAAALGLMLREQTHLADAYQLATSHYPETYTELYFKNSTKLPVRVTAGKTYAYTVHLTSHQAGTQTYRLLSTVTIPGAQPASSTQTVTVAAGRGADATFRFTVPKTGETAQITVSVAGGAQSIAFRSQS